MKLHWGTGIAIFYTLFVLVLVIAVIKSTQVDHSLVAEDYYQQDLEYQTRIDKQVNALNLERDLQVSYSASNRGIRFQFPNPAEIGPATGTILFFRPSNQALDFELAIQLDEKGEQVVPTRDMLPGLWKVMVDWEAGGKEFYKEEVIIF